MKILILSAFEDELLTFKKTMLTFQERKRGKLKYIAGKYHENDIFVALTGIGTTRASVTVAMLCAHIGPDVIFLAGTAGGLKPNQSTGDILIASEVIDLDLIHLPRLLGETPYAPCLTDPHHDKPLDFSYKIDIALLECLLSLNFPNISSGIIATSNIFPAPKEALIIMKEKDSCAIEMEGSGACYAAALHDIPLIMLRAISNSLDSLGNDLGTPKDALITCSNRLSEFLLFILKNTPLLQKICRLYGIYRL